MPTTTVNSPNGPIKVNHPEGATEAEIIAYAKSYSQAHTPEPEPVQAPKPYGGREGVLEAPLSMLTGALSGPVAGLAGIGAALMPGGKTGAEAVEDVTEALTYQPRTVTGGQALDAISKPFIAYEQWADKIGEKSGKPSQALGATAVKTALLAAPMFLGLGRGKVTPRQTVAKKAQARGYVTDPVATNPASGTGMLEGLGGVQKTRRQASVRNQQVTDAIARKEVGLPPDTPITVEALSAVRKNAADSYQALEGAGLIKTDQAFFKAIDKAKDRFTKTGSDFPTLSKKAGGGVVKIADEISKPSFQADSAIQAMRLLRDNADEAFRAGKNSQGSAWRKLSDALEDAVERDLVRRGPESAGMVERFRASRQLIAKTHSIESALDGTSVSATKLAAQLKRGKPLSGDLKTTAQFAADYPLINRVIKDNVAAFSPLDLGAGMASLGASVAAGTATANPAVAMGALLPLLSTASRPMMRALALSKMGQKAAVTPPPAINPAGLLGTATEAGLVNQ